MKKSVIRYRVVFFLLVSAFLFGLVLGSTGTSEAAEDKAIELTFQGKWSGHEKENWAAEQLKLTDYVKAATNGRIVLKNMDEIVRDNEVLDAVRTGTLDMGCQTLFSRRELSLLNYISLPIVPHKKMPEIMGKLKPLFADVWANQLSVQQLGYAFFLTQNLYTKNPVTTLEELKGKKLRVLGNSLVKLYKLAGAAPITMNQAEVYTSLQRGLIDGAQTALPGYLSGAWYEVAKYMSAWPLGGSGMGIVMNKDVWNKLDPELQKQFMSAMAIFEKAQFEGVYKDLDSAEKKAMSLGAIRKDPPQTEKDKLMAFVGEVLEDWKGTAGPHAGEVLKAVNEVLGTNYK
ncbi:MAG: TRAP transporter substrate-binding protein DctP [Deltaproteobacteria bacterium]|nr:TRAP transporter substrate-binding protein DctP [Deltaproteobacteria bacterium]